MFASSQFGSVQFGSVLNQTRAGAFITLFETITSVDDLNQAVTLIRSDIVTLVDSISQSTILPRTETITLRDYAQLTDPTDGDIVGYWRRVPKITGVWTRF